MSTVATAPAEASTASGGRPASVSTQTPAPSSGQSPASTGRDYGSELAFALGGIPRERAPETLDAPDGQSATPTADPSSEGHPDSVVATDTGLPAASEEAAGQEQQFDDEGNPIEQVVLPGDDLLQDLAELELPKEDKGQGAQPENPVTTSEGPLTPEQIEQIANPDGNATLEQRYKNLQSVIGRQGQSYGKALSELKQAQAKLQDIAKGIQQFAELVSFDATSGKITPTPQGLFKLIEMSGISDAQWNEMLAERGVKIVPLHAKVDDSADSNADLKAVLDKMLPGDELTFEEKLLEAEGWTGAKKRQFEDQLLDRKMQRRIQDLEEAAVRRLQEQQAKEQARQEAERINKVVDAFLAKIDKRKDGKELLPAIKYWNRQLPKNMDIEARCKALFALAQASRMPTVIKQVRDATLKFAAEQQGRNFLASAAVPIGEVPTIVNSRNGQTPGISRSDRAALASALLGSR